MLRNVIQKEIVRLINEEPQDEIESRAKSDMLHSSLCTGQPDFFSDDMRWFWDNRRPGNV